MLIRELLQALSGRYDTRPDFTVVFQPFMKVLNAPWSEAASGQFKLAPIDQTFVTYDCFHFSQKGHAMSELTFVGHIRSWDHWVSVIMSHKIILIFIVNICVYCNVDDVSVANLYWNNLLEPVGNKTDGAVLPKLLQRFLCPTERAPFIFTNENSERYLRTGLQ